MDIWFKYSNKNLYGDFYYYFCHNFFNRNNFYSPSHVVEFNSIILHKYSTIRLTNLDKMTMEKGKKRRPIHLPIKHKKHVTLLLICGNSSIQMLCHLNSFVNNGQDGSHNLQAFSVMYYRLMAFPSFFLSNDWGWIPYIMGQSRVSIDNPLLNTSLNQGNL